MIGNDGITPPPHAPAQPNLLFILFFILQHINALFWLVVVCVLIDWWPSMLKVFDFFINFPPSNKMPLMHSNSAAPPL